MTLDEARSVIETYFQTKWTATPIQYFNVPFVPPATGEWVKIGILPGSTSIGSLGENGYDDERGIVDVLIFTPENVGTAKAFQYAGGVKALFRRKIISGVHFLPPTVMALPDLEYGKFCVNVTIPFRFFTA